MLTVYPTAGSKFYYMYMCTDTVHVCMYMYMYVHIVNPQRTCAARVIVLGLSFCWLVDLSYLSVTMFSATVHNKAAKK